jgi:hypothetical protein
MKVGVVGFTKNVRDLFPEEESYSGSAITNAFFFRFLVEEYNADLYCLGKTNKKTYDIAQQKIKEGDPYTKKIHFYPRFLPDDTNFDLIVVLSSDTNPINTDFIDGIVCSRCFHMFRILNKYRKTPRIFLQTDFGTPFKVSSEANYNDLSVLVGSYDLLYSEQLPVILVTGIKKDPYLKYDKMYNYPLVKLIATPPDFHFITDLDFYRNKIGYKYDPVDSPLGVYYGGKDRRFGSRANQLYEYMKAGNKIYISGKWSPDSVEKFNSTGNWVFLGNFKEHKQVIEAMNKVGFSLYISNQEYNEGGVITGRFRDSLLAMAVPLIDKESVKPFEMQFDREDFELIKQLIVTPKTLRQKLEEFHDIGKRTRIINRLWEMHRKYREKVISQIRLIIDTALKGGFKQKPDFMKYLIDFINEKRKNINASRRYMHYYWDWVEKVWYKEKDYDQVFQEILDVKPHFRKKGFKELLEFFADQTSEKIGRKVSLREFYDVFVNPHLKLQEKSV